MKRTKADYILGFTGIVSGWSFIAWLIGNLLHANHYFNLAMLVIFVLGLAPLGLYWFNELALAFLETILLPLSKRIRKIFEPSNEL